MLEIDAMDEGAAKELAKRKFCETERLCEWSLRADRIQIDLAIHSDAAPKISPVRN